MGLPGHDWLYGEAGADRLFGGAGADVLAGEAGVDTASSSYADSNAAVQVDLGRGTATGGHAEGDTLTGIDNLIGSRHSDSLTGDAHANRLWDAGNDRLFGSGGNDVLVGGAGADTLDGEGGADTFRYSAAADSTPAAAGRDQFLHFSGAGGGDGDKLDLSGLGKALTFIGSADFSNTPGQVRVT